MRHFEELVALTNEDQTSLKNFIIKSFKPESRVRVCGE